MKILMLVMDERLALLEGLYSGIQSASDCDIARLSPDEQADLKTWYRKNVRDGQYDRVLVFLRVKKMMKQPDFFFNLPNLCFLEYDAYQNYMQESKYFGRFLRFYQYFPWCRVICSGVRLNQDLVAAGIDSQFVPKGYDHEIIADRRLPRDIPYGFIGSTNHGAYTERRQFLQGFTEKLGLQATRTESGEPYVAMLNRIKFFITCDAGMREYMIKNFEAMVAGCILVTYDHGPVENAAVDLRDMENAILYTSVEEAIAKIRKVEADPELAAKIVTAAQESVIQLSYRMLGKKIVNHLKQALRPKTISPWTRIFRRLFHRI